MVRVLVHSSTISSSARAFETRRSRVRYRSSWSSSWPPHHRKDAFDLAVCRGGEAHKAISGAEDPERDQSGHLLAGPDGHAAPLHCVKRLRADERRQRAEHRHVEVLPDARLVSLPQRRQDADDGEEWGGQVTEGHAATDRRVVLVAARQHQAAERLDHHVHRLAGAGRPVQPEAGDGTVDDTWVEGGAPDCTRRRADQGRLD